MPLDLSRIQAICFDIDGTLRDTDDQYALRLAHWLWPVRAVLPYKNPLLLARWAVMALESPGNLGFELADRLGLDGHLDRLSSGLHIRRHARPSPASLIIEGVSEMLEWLAPRYSLAVITARGEHITRCFLDEFALRPYFMVVATGLTCRHTKPFPDPLLYVAGRMGVAPGNCLMVGDTSVDIVMGRAAGAQTVGVLCGFGEESELLRKGADVILKRTPDLVDLLGETNDGQSGVAGDPI